MRNVLKIAMAVTALAAAAQVAAQVTFYEREDFEGRSFTTEQRVNNLQRRGFNDRASSAVVMRGRWEVCDEPRFEGRCVVLRPGRYQSLTAMGMNNRVSSLRTVGAAARFDDQRYAPQPTPVYDSRRRNNERLYQANITSVRAVVGQAERRCWVEREQVSPGRGDANVPGALIGAVIGGVLGHQVGGGTGKDLATVGGVVAGGVVGANVGREGASPGYGRDVQRCSDVPNAARPEYWDVTYNFRGIEHHMQTTTPPGASVTVNRAGEPRS